MIGSSTIARILIAAIPVTAMLVIEGVLSRKNRRRLSPEASITRARQGELPKAVTTGASCSVEPDSTSRRRQYDHYFQALYQSAQTGSLSAMNKLGEFSFVRRKFVEAFYWKLMLEMRHGRSSGLPAQGVCRLWQDAGCPAPNVYEGGSFTESQARLAMAVLDLWSGRHVHTPKATIRQMMEEGDKDALLYAKRYGIGRARS